MNADCGASRFEWLGLCVCVLGVVPALSGCEVWSGRGSSDC